MLTNIGSVPDGIVDRTVGGRRLRSIVSSVRRVMTAISGCCAGMHLRSMVIVVAAVCCKILQVSNYYFLRQT